MIVGVISKAPPPCLYSSNLLTVGDCSRCQQADNAVEVSNAASPGSCVNAERGRRQASKCGGLLLHVCSPMINGRCFSSRALTDTAHSKWSLRM